MLFIWCLAFALRERLLCLTLFLPFGDLLGFVLVVLLAHTRVITGRYHLETGARLTPAKGFREAKAFGVIDRLPRIALVRAQRGGEIAVDDSEIFDAKRCIGREGIGCEPASAASLAGAKALRASNVIAADADVVAVLTGHALKDARAGDHAA